MQKIVSVVMAIIPLIIASGEELVPTADGTTWLYQMTQEAGKEFSFSDAKPGPDGKVRAFHIHGEQTSPMHMTIDRWFVNGTGIVKDVTTIKMPDGDLLRRISLELKERPKIAPRPKVKSVPLLKKISVTVGKALT